MIKDMKVLVIIPAYNEEKSIEKVVENLQAAYPQADYLIVNDCSTDRTAEICRERGFSFLSLPTNLGIGGGVQSGYLYAAANDYDIAVQMDGDGQHDPKYLAALLEPVMNGEADMAIGSRFITKEGFQTSGMRRVGIKMLKGTIRLCSGVVATDATSGFRACSKELIRFFSRNYAQDYPEPEAIVAAALNGFTVKDVPVVMNERTEGVSSIGLLDSVYYMIKVNLAIIACRLTNLRKRKGGTAK